MTLRNDIHAAIDEIGPPAPALADQILAALGRTSGSSSAVLHRRPNPWRVGAGRLGSLVAAVLVVLLMAALVVGVHVLRDRNLLNIPPAPAHQGTPGTTTSPNPSASPPPGGPVPTRLQGNWFLPPAAYIALNGSATPCPAPATAANCNFELTLMATTYREAYTARGGTQQAGQGDVVVNNNEIDFFNGVLCGRHLPDGVGRYRWALTGGVLYLTLISDPCPRPGPLVYQGWSRTP
jgi:hypothetical protein